MSCRRQTAAWLLEQTMNDLGRRTTTFVMAQQGWRGATTTPDFQSLKRFALQGNAAPAAVSLADQESGSSGADLGLGRTARLNAARIRSRFFLDLLGTRFSGFDLDSGKPRFATTSHSLLQLHDEYSPICSQQPQA